MKKTLIILFIIGLSTNIYAQDPIKLSEVVIVARNYKYLNKIDNTEAAIPVKMLERKVAAYDIKSSDYYDDEYDYYTVSFFIPEGKIVAVYNKDGKIIQTIEKFTDVKLPTAVAKAVTKRFPQWKIAKDVYLVNFSDHKESAKKRYKITLENGDQRLKIKTDAEGNFL
jgi:hypothetical protein